MSLEPTILTAAQRAAGKAEGLVFNRSTEQFNYISDGQIVGYTGLMPRGSGVVFKNHFINPPHRHQGHFKQLLTELSQLARERGYQTARATCTPSSLQEYRQRGAAIIKTYKNGCTEVSLPL